MQSKTSPQRALRRAKKEFGIVPPFGRIVSFTESKGEFLGLIETEKGERIFGKIVSIRRPEIGDRVRPVLRIVSKSMPIEYGFSWERE